MLNQTRTQTPPAASRRRSVEPRRRLPTKAGGKAVATKPQNVRSGVAGPANVSRPDRAELMSRAQSLLAQLTEIEERLQVAQKDGGLSGNCLLYTSDAADE